LARASGTALTRQEKQAQYPKFYPRDPVGSAAGLEYFPIGGKSDIACGPSVVPPE